MLEVTIAIASGATRAEALLANTLENLTHICKFLNLLMDLTSDREKAKESYKGKNFPF